MMCRTSVGRDEMPNTTFRPLDPTSETRSLWGELPKSPPRQKLSPEELRARAIAGSLDEKLTYFGDRVVFTAAFEQAIDTAGRLMKYALSMPEPGGLQILAAGGSGKTFLKKNLLEEYPAVDSLYKLVVPFVAIELLSTDGEKELLAGILAQCGERLNPSLFTANELENKIVDAFKEVGVHGLYIDEANRLDTATKNSRKDGHKLGPIGERLKLIHGRTKVAFIFAGTPELEALLDSDPQYSTRWSAKVRLAPFELNDEFRGVIHALAEALPLPGETDFSNPAFAEAMWCACAGNFRVLKKLLCDALVAAYEDKAGRILPTHLAKAWNMTGDFSKPNPFSGLK